MLGSRDIPPETRTISEPHSLLFRQRFYFTAVILLILGVDIVLAYLIYLIARTFW